MSWVTGTGGEDPLTKIAWSASLHREVQRDTFWSSPMGRFIARTKQIIGTVVNRFEGGWGTDAKPRTIKGWLSALWMGDRL